MAKQQKLIKEIPTFWRPEFIPYFPEEKVKYKLNDKETLLYGFIRYFLKNCSGKFFFTNEQLRYVFGGKRNGTLSENIASLANKCPEILLSYQTKSDGGTVRMISFSSSDLRKTVHLTYGKPYAIKNTNKNTIRNIATPTLQEEKTPINHLIELFKSVNPSYKTLYANKTERSALERLVKEHGEESVKTMIEQLPNIITKPYAPRVTTPYQLEKKLGDLAVFIKQSKGKERSAGSPIIK